jgi:acetyl-CoA/propionyl-CoA carboxylase biotin carboxyl carrier protein
MPTVIPFHAAVVRDPAFIGDADGFGIYTLWIENEFDNQIAPYAGDVGQAEEAEERRRVTVEVGGRRLEVVLPGGLGAMSSGNGNPSAKRPRRAAGSKAGAGVSGDAVSSPMQGTIVKVAVEEGQLVEEGDVIVVLEAMKMEQPLKAHKAGTVTGLHAEVGATVTNGAVLCELKG